VKLLVNTSVSSLALHRKGAGSLSPDEKKLKAELVQAIQDGRVAMLGRELECTSVRHQGKGPI